jgi:antitoxin ParD1/3/4
MARNSSLNIPLTEEMKQFITNQTGDGTMYATPSEYVRDLIRHEREKQEAANVRSAILEGYQDAISGNMTDFSGNLLEDIKAFKTANP